MNLRKFGSFIGGIVFGTAGVAILTSKDAKKVYSHCTAAVLRGKDCIMDKVAATQEGCGDIYADAKDINEKRYAEQKAAKIAAAKAVLEEYADEETEE